MGNLKATVVISVVAGIVIGLLIAVFAGRFMKRSEFLHRDFTWQHPSKFSAAPLVENETLKESLLPTRDENLVFEVTSDKSTASVGEKIKLNYDLFTRYNTRYEGFKSEGRFRGFWIESLEMPENGAMEKVKFKGRNYVQAKLRELILSPIYGGDLVINPGAIKISFAEDDAENAPMREGWLDSKPITIHIDNPAGKSKGAFLNEFLAKQGVKAPPPGAGIQKPALIILLDISGSMNAEDMQPLNRLVAAKVAISQFLQMNTDVMVGLKCFAAEVQAVSPLTSSKREVEKALDKVQIGLIKDGTAIGDAVFEAVKDLAGYDGSKKIIILLTDGVNNGGHLDPLTATDFASHHGIVIHTVSLGNKGLAPFPVNDPQFGNRVIAVQIETDEETLAEMAKETGGKYGAPKSEADLELLLQNIQKTLGE